MSAMTDTVLPRPISPAAQLWSDFVQSRVAVACLAALVLLLAVALLAPLIAPQNPYDIAAVRLRDARLAPMSRMMSGTLALLGTDAAGRDLLSAILYGLRTSLFVGIASGAIAMVIGSAVGLVSGYRGGKLDALLMRLVDLQLSFPGILVALLLIAAWGHGVDKVVIALVIVQWAYYARTARAAALVERGKDYIEADRCLVIPTVRIIFRHLLPNCLPALIVVGTMQTAHAISLEATLSFLGVGLPVTEPSLGLLIANGFDYMLSGRYWISFFPGFALLMLVVLINILGDRLREILNPKLAR
jgi:peptide/nickel transport system permease protein